MKYTIDNIKLLGRNRQIRNQIIDKFGSLEAFATKVNMSVKTVDQYLRENSDFYGKFKGKLAEHLGDYNSLVKSDKQQVEEYVEKVVWNIHLYRDKKDIEVLEYLLKLSNDLSFVQI